MTSRRLQALGIVSLALLVCTGCLKPPDSSPSDSWGSLHALKAGEWMGITLTQDALVTTRRGSTPIDVRLEATFVSMDEEAVWISVDSVLFFTKPDEEVLYFEDPSPGTSSRVRELGIATEGIVSHGRLIEARIARTAIRSVSKRNFYFWYGPLQDCLWGAWSAMTTGRFIYYPAPTPLEGCALGLWAWYGDTSDTVTMSRSSVYLEPGAPEWESIERERIVEERQAAAVGTYRLLTVDGQEFPVVAPGDHETDATREITGGYIELHANWRFTWVTDYRHVQAGEAGGKHVERVGRYHFWTESDRVEFSLRDGGEHVLATLRGNTLTVEMDAELIYRLVEPF